MSSVTSIHQYFQELIDPRVSRTQKHDCLNIVAITLCAIICGADNWVAIEEYGKSKELWFKTFLDLENGIPSHDTISRFFAALDSKHFNELFLSWSLSISEKISKHICIDGKTMRGTRSVVKGLKGAHLVNAWCVENQICLGQVSVDSKTNEITAIPELLDILDIKDTVITIDAMGCQKEIANKIIDKKGDYILALKQNQGSLYDDVSQYFTGQNDFKDKIERANTIEKNGGRIEGRECYLLKDIDYLKEHDWPELNSIIMIKSTREINGESSIEKRFYISSLKSFSAEKMLELIREHWQVENNLHWQLDVAFNEDNWISRVNNAAKNKAIMNKIALNILKNEKTAKVGVKNKRLKAAWDHDYLKKVIQATV